MGKTFRNYGAISGTVLRYDITTNGTFKSEFSYFNICSNYFDFDTDLEEEANVNEERNEDCFTSL